MPPELAIDKHARYFKFALTMLPSSATNLDATRMTLVHLCLVGLAALGRLDATLPLQDRQAMVEWIYAQQIPATGDNAAYRGFRGGSLFGPHAACASAASNSANVAATYSALGALLLLGDDLSRVDAAAVVAALRHIQLPSGSFAPHPGTTESDPRFIYCACAISAMLGDWSGVDRDAATRFIVSCVGLDGGLSQAPLHESHGGHLYCCIASLALMGRLDALPDRSRTLHWALMRLGSTAEQGGYQGRANKAADVCYSFWIGAAVELLGGHNLVDPALLADFTLACEAPYGGVAKCPGAQPDPLHAALAIVGLGFFDAGAPRMSPALLLPEALHMHRARKVGYYTAWSIYDRGFLPADVPAERLTHINYGFAKLDGNRIALGDAWADVEKPYDGGVRGNFGALNSAHGPVRRRNPHIRTLISVGGWTWSGGFSAMAASPESRREFVCSVGDFLEAHAFDGVDIDWEHPVEGGMDGNAHSPHDAENYLRLLHELRQHLDAERAPPRFGRYEITIATSAAPAVYRHLNLAAIAHAVDAINIMAYDYAGPWSASTAHQQNLFGPAAGDSGLSGNATVSDYLRRGVPPHKINLGVGFYGRGFANVDHHASPVAALPGLGCPFRGVPDGTWEAGSFDYKALRRTHLAPDSGYSAHWDDDAKAPILFSASDRVLITYEDPIAVSWKADYVLRNKLGGIMIWELSQDHEGELLAKICEYLG
ncbi:hypothetical protein GGI07_005402 [Coemansia sp. Benny D115]|nr:hypothetical protein GGI07_005402 [Coemansia sp. Benny D115]